MGIQTMTLPITRDLLDKKELIAAFYQGVEAGTGKTIKRIIQRGLTVIIEFEP